MHSSNKLSEFTIVLCLLWDEPASELLGFEILYMKKHNNTIILSDPTLY